MLLLNSTPGPLLFAHYVLLCVSLQIMVQNKFKLPIIYSVLYQSVRYVTANTMATTGCARGGLGGGLFYAPKCRKVHTVKHIGQVSEGKLCEIFKILIISAVKICKQCLKTTSARGFALNPIGDFRPQTSWATAFNKKIPGVANDGHILPQRLTAVCVADRLTR